MVPDLLALTVLVGMDKHKQALTCQCGVDGKTGKSRLVLKGWQRLPGGSDV